MARRRTGDRSVGRKGGKHETWRWYSTLSKKDETGRGMVKEDVFCVCLFVYG